MDKDLDFDDEDLVEIVNNENQWKGVALALLVIVSICSLIILSIILLTPSSNFDKTKIEIFEINQILDEEFKPQLFNGTWISGYEFIFKDTNGAIALFDARNNKVITIYVQSSITKQYDVQKFSLSPDRRFVLLISDYRKMFNLTSTAKYIVYNITNESIIHLEDIVRKDLKVLIQSAKWGPIGNSLVFVSNNDIFYIPFIGGEVKRITNTGKEGIIFNGIVDFLYRETIFTKESTIWWSEDGSNICYATIDNTRVQETQLIYYGSLNNSENESLKIMRYKYPKALQNIPKVSLWVAYLNSGQMKQLGPPKQISNVDYYVTYVNWIKKDMLTVIWTLRNQNNSIISTCSEIDLWICKEVISISSASTLKKLAQSFLPSNDGLTYFMICLRPDSLIGSHYHISTFNITEKFVETFITFGRYDVTKLLFYDKISQTLYFEASLSIIPEKHHIYKIATKARHVQCITCNLTFINCGYFEAIFSLTAQYYALQCLGPSIPKVFLLKLDDQIKQNNENLRLKMIKKVQLSHDIFPIISENKKLHIKLLLPQNFDRQHFNKYPLLIEANSPENSVITEKFDINWSHYLVSKHKYIYGWIEKDSQKWRHEKQMQNYFSIKEIVEDYRIALNYIKEKMQFINKRQICMRGKTIGAFIAMSTLASSEAFNCALIQSPVTNWRYMDAVRAEYLFNSWNSHNYAMLESFNLINKLNKLIDKHILFIHGSADEKVHIEQTMQMTKHLIVKYMQNGWNLKSEWDTSGPLQQLQLYPDEDHSLHKVRHHMYKTMESFLDYIFNQSHKNCIKPKGNK